MLLSGGFTAPPFMATVKRWTVGFYSTVHWGGQNKTPKTDPSESETNGNHVRNAIRIFECEEGFSLSPPHRSDPSSADILHLVSGVEASVGVMPFFFYHFWSFLRCANGKCTSCMHSTHTLETRGTNQPSLYNIRRTLWCFLLLFLLFKGWRVL